jgi:hypothetical protein
MQLCNAYTQEVVREERYDNPDVINSLIKSAEKSVSQGLESFIIDDQKRTLKAEYITHSIIKGTKETLYKIFFKVKVNEVQER